MLRAMDSRLDVPVSVRPSWTRPLMLAQVLAAFLAWGIPCTWLVSVTGCGPKATRFEGAARFPGGPSACQARCSADGLTMSGFVYSGEFATSCVCRPSPAPDPAAPGGGPGAPTSATDPAADLLAPNAPTGVGEAELSAQAAAAAAEAARVQSQQQLLQHRKP